MAAAAATSAAPNGTKTNADATASEGKPTEDKNTSHDSKPATLAPSLVENTATDNSSSSSSSLPSSRSVSTDSLKDLPDKNGPSPKTLRARGQIPLSIPVTVLVILSLQITSGLYYSNSSFIPSVIASFQTSIYTLGEKLTYMQDLFASIPAVKLDTVQQQYTREEYLYSTLVIAVILSIMYVLIYSPLRAGMWTGKRASRHLVHRYMGLLFLIQYGLAWVEYLTNYNTSSYLPHTIALNGVIQAISAYFSFKVLPDLDDAGYFSDRAVLSRMFVHENIFYQIMTIFGSLYYNDSCRTKIESTMYGQALIYLFIFAPYVFLRPLFPTTRFRNAGTSRAGRTKQNELFYSVGTTMIKIFYLWAKYFLGFYINWVVFLNLATDANMKFIRGLFLLNVGTVSIAVFLHTLRFKKVLPPRFTFSLYIAQIYATFSALPYAYEMFVAHQKLCALALSGVLFNMTRSRKMHALWCFGVFYLMNFVEVDW